MMSSPTISSASVPKTNLKKSDYKRIAEIRDAPGINASNLEKFGGATSPASKSAATAAALTNQTGGNIMGFTYE